eukprot:TRINITY_DN54615_c0_g1_i1.p1 TRINITY_DN54615_c0_g1~~TRINITY_DN54615_c0_g1_i1.p1  ORF type:complete len:481 (+),score=55.98 TRINITY_DN54615_c0_g1_i1:118-1443(+)
MESTSRQHDRVVRFATAWTSAALLSAAGLMTGSQSVQASETSAGEEECAECVRKAARVFCGGEHTLLRDPRTLEVYQLGACGLGFAHDDADAAADAKNYERKVPLPNAAAAVFAGYYHNFFKLTNGRCYTYGCGRQAPNDGQLIIDADTEETTPVPTSVRFAEAVLGGHHSVCRTARGEVWASGAGWQGQMANGGLEYKNVVPLRIDSLPRVQKLSTGYYHNAALSDDGEWYVWGCNEQEQLGKKPAGEERILKPRKLSECVPELAGVRIQTIDGGYGHSVFLSSDGRVFTAGNHSEGQRGVSPEGDDIPPPGEVAGLGGPVEAIAAGSHHTLAVVKGRVMAFGSDEYGQVSGRGEPAEDSDDVASWRPCVVAGLPDNDPVVRVSAGICHSAAQTASGRVFLWGCGGNGQTGDGSLPTSSPTREIDMAAVAKRCSRAGVMG